MLRPHLTLLVLIVGCTSAQAADPIRLTIRDHRFVPDQVTVPAGEKFKVEVMNQDETPEEPRPQGREDRNAGTIFVTAGPLKPGQYRFIGEYHEDTANGAITAFAPAKE
jgi:hypothetical protein